VSPGTFPVVPDRQGTPVEFHVCCELAFSGVEGGRDRGAVVEARPHVGEFGGVTGAPLVAGDRREPRSGAVVELVLPGVRVAREVLGRREVPQLPIPKIIALSVMMAPTGCAGVNCVNSRLGLIASHFGSAD